MVSIIKSQYKATHAAVSLRLGISPLSTRPQWQHRASTAVVTFGWEISPQQGLYYDKTAYGGASSSTPWMGEQRVTKPHRDKTRQDETRRDKTRQDETRRDKTRQDETRQKSLANIQHPTGLQRATVTRGRPET